MGVASDDVERDAGNPRGNRFVQRAGSSGAAAYGGEVSALKHRTVVSAARRPGDARRRGSGPLHLLSGVWSALSRLSRRQHVVLAVCLVALVAWVDLVTGEQISVSIFYTGPVFLLTWFVSRRAGVVGSFLCAGARLALALGTDSSVPKLIAVWNTDVELGLFLLCAFAFGTLKEALDREQALSQTDQLTGVASQHAFFDRLELEIERSRRDLLRPHRGRNRRASRAGGRADVPRQVRREEGRLGGGSDAGDGREASARRGRGAGGPLRSRDLDGRSALAFAHSRRAIGGPDENSLLP
jgi:hypothetical protein